MLDFFFSEQAFARELQYFDFGQRAPTWGFLLAFVLLLTSIDLYRLARAYRLAKRSDEAIGAVMKSLPASLLSCTGGLLLSLLMGMSVMLLGRVVVLGLGAMVLGVEQNTQSSPVTFTWVAFGASLLLSVLALFSLRSPDVVVDADEEEDDPSQAQSSGGRGAA